MVYVAAQLGIKQMRRAYGYRVARRNQPPAG